jgi:mannose-6-phosphate isomerase class I
LVRCGSRSPHKTGFTCPRALLGEKVHARFGAEFPIRFDFLDTIGGQNLSFQVHPVTEYIQQQFGMHYTQDESYYILEAQPDAVVYLGTKTGIEPQAMLDDLRPRGGEKPLTMPALLTRSRRINTITS